MMRGSGASRGNARLHNGSTIAMGDGSKCAMDGGMAIAMGDGGGDGRWWQQWATAGVTMGDSDSGGMILMGINDGGAMYGRTAATAQWQSP
jgi:hypothetical protein